MSWIIQTLKILQVWQIVKRIEIRFLYSSTQKEVSDPYYGEKKDFKVCYSILENACNKIVLDLNL